MEKPAENYQRRLLIATRVIFWIGVAVVLYNMFGDSAAEGLTTASPKKKLEMSGDTWIVLLKIAGVSALGFWFLSLLQGGPLHKMGLTKYPLTTILLSVLFVIVILVLFNVIPIFRL